METWRRFDFKYVVLLCVNEKKCDFTAAARRTRPLSWALMSCCGMKTQTEVLMWSLTVTFILSCSALCNLWSEISDPELLNALQLFNWSPAQPVSPGGNSTGMPQLWLKEMLTTLRLQEKQATRSLARRRWIHPMGEELYAGQADRWARWTERVVGSQWCCDVHAMEDLAAVWHQLHL